MRTAHRFPARTDAVTPRRRWSTLVAAVAALVALVLVAGCTSTTTSDGSTASTGTGLFDSSQVHTVAVEYDEDDYDAMIDTYLESGDKEWITATVTIDGTVIEDVGLKLKGNSTLRGLTSAGTDDGDGGDSSDGDASADDPAGLPWRIRLDKYVDGQSYEGQTDLVVRGNSTETSLNEAVALDLIAEAGLASEQATAVRFSANGSDEQLRLVVQNPGEVFDAENFDSGGVLYKALSTGDYSYRGDDPADYADAFEVKASSDGEEDLTPLIAFLKFIDESDDETFAAELGDYLDVDSLATYLAVQDLVANTDDIDGPGNNSYLRYDTETGLMTVVSWDQNLSFGGFGGGGGGGGVPGGGTTADDTGRGPGGGFGGGDDQGGDRPSRTAPTDAPDGEAPAGLPDLPDGGGAPGDAPADGGGGMGGMGGDNALVTRFLANDTFAALESAAAETLQTDLVDSGRAQEILDAWVSVLTEGASDLVDADTIQEEADAIATYVTAGSSGQQPSTGSAGAGRTSDDPEDGTSATEGTTTSGA